MTTAKIEVLLTITDDMIWRATKVYFDRTVDRYAPGQPSYSVEFDDMRAALEAALANTPESERK